MIERMSDADPIERMTERADETDHRREPGRAQSAPRRLHLTRRISLRQLEVFTLAARQLNFSRVAESLHLTQPAVSMQIRQIEQAVGLPLFDKIGRQKVLTEAGELLLKHASRMLGELGDAEHSLQAMKGLAGGTVGIGLVSTAKYFAPRLMAQFRKLHPQIDLRFVVGNREQLVRLLQENQIDLAVMGRPPAEMDTTSEPLAANPHVLVAASDHRLRSTRDIDLHSLQDETFLIREPGSGTRAAMEEWFRDRGFLPGRLIALDSNETIKQAVMAGLGVSLLSVHSVGLELRAGEIALLDVTGLPLQRVWHMVHLSRRWLSPPAVAFREFLIEQTDAYLEAILADLPADPARHSPRTRARQEEPPARAKPGRP